MHDSSFANDVAVVLLFVRIRPGEREQPGLSLNVTDKRANHV
jgi:hypothetical protein